MKQILLAIFAGTVIFSCSNPVQKSQNQDAEITIFFDSVFDDHLSRDPEYQTVLGDKSQYDKWNDIYDEKAIEENQLSVRLSTCECGAEGLRRSLSPKCCSRKAGDRRREFVHRTTTVESVQEGIP